MKQLLPDDILPKGTPVAGGGLRGVVVGCKVGDGSMIANVHTVEVRERYKRGFGSTGKWVPVEPYLDRRNYSAWKYDLTS